MKRKIYLDGELGDKFGKVLVLDVQSFKDVFKALDAQRPEFRTYLAECHENKIGFIMHVEDSPLTADEELLMNFSEGDMYISPAPEGSGGKLGGFLKIVAAAVIAFVVIPWAVTAYGLSGGWLAAAYGATLGLAVSGLADLMAPDPATDVENDSRQDSSYLFQGSGQTILEGDPVPLLYGRLRIPGRLIDFDVRNKNSQFTEIGFGPSSGGTDITPDPGNDEQNPGGPDERAPDPNPPNPNQPTIPGQTEQINIGVSTTPVIVFDPSTVFNNF